MVFPRECPIADVKEWLPARLTGGPMPSSRGLVLHVNAGNGDPYYWWTNPAAPTASSHFQLMKDGRLIQYVPLDTVAWCQVAGSSTWHSIETEGFPGEPLTAAAVSKLAKLYAWGHLACGWAMKNAETPWDTGFGWHGMGGLDWGGHYGCPGDARKAQRAQILQLAAGSSSIGKSDPVAANLSKMPVIDPGKDIGHPHTVELIKAVLKVANPEVDLSSKQLLTWAIMQWQAVLLNDWKFTGGPRDGTIKWGVCDMDLLTGIMLAVALQDKK